MRTRRRSASTSATAMMLFTGDPLPGVNRRSLGTEPMTCASNALQRGEGLATLQPGESFAATRGIEPA